MKTDLPLKLLSLLRTADLLPFLGLPATDVVEVVVRELPTTRRALDTLIRIRSPQGQEYLHLLEWQGYGDRAALWRLGGYMALVGQTEPQTTIVGTIVYLKPADDVGDTLTMVVDGEVQHQWGFRCIRLWEQDAVAAVATGNLALATLSPLMRGADAPLVEQAVQLVLQTAPPAQQADLLSILGVFAAPLMAPEQFIHLVTKEKLMSSELMEYLAQDIIAEQEAKWQARLATERQALEAQLTAERQMREAERQIREAEREALEARLEAEREAREAERQMREAERQALEARLEAERQTLEAEREAHQQAEQEMHRRIEREAHLAQLQTERETLAALVALRFPDAPLRLTTLIHKITDVGRLQALRADVPELPDLATLEQRLRDAV